MDDGKKVSLIFSFYLTDDFDTNIANKMHFCCLKKYNSYFFESLFVILIDDPTNYKLISRFEKTIIDCGFVNNVKFEVIKNHAYREAYVFKTYIIDRLHDYNNLVCFAHNKGVTNVIDPTKDVNSILTWIFTLYFGIFNYFDEAIQRMIQENSISLFFGSCLSNKHYVDDKFDTGFAPIYNGTIYLLSPGEIIDYTNMRGIKISPLSNRWYAEHFPATILRHDDFSIMHRAASHDLRSFSYYLVDKIYEGENGGWSTYVEYLFKEDIDQYYEELNEFLDKVYKNDIND